MDVKMYGLNDSQLRNLEKSLLMHESLYDDFVTNGSRILVSTSKGRVQEVIGLMLPYFEPMVNIILVDWES